MSPEQREVEQEEGSEAREEGQDSPIACGDDIHLYDNQLSPGPGQCAARFPLRPLRTCRPPPPPPPLLFGDVITSRHEAAGVSAVAPEAAARSKKEKNNFEVISAEVFWSPSRSPTAAVDLTDGSSAAGADDFPFLFFGLHH